MKYQNKPIKALDVYFELMQRADELRKNAKNLPDDSYRLSDREHVIQVAQELYYFAGRLEETPEINPPKS